MLLASRSASRLGGRSAVTLSLQMSIVFDEGVEIFRYISQQYGLRYFPEVETRTLARLNLYTDSCFKFSFRDPRLGKQYGITRTRLPFD